jgi:uncharacterized phiE125 gp8 family phage protein
MSIIPIPRSEVRYAQQIEATLPAISGSDMTVYLPYVDESQAILIDTLILSATQMVEDYLSRSLINKQFEQTYDGFLVGSSSELLYPPCQSIDSVEVITTAISGGEPVSYIYDEDNYTLDQSRNRYYDRIILNEGYQTPSDMRDEAGFVITYTAGYGESYTDVPYNIRQAIAMLTSYLFTNRGDCEGGGDPIVSSGAAAILSPYKLLRLGFN